MGRSRLLGEMPSGKGHRQGEIAIRKDRLQGEAIFREGSPSGKAVFREWALREGSPPGKSCLQGEVALTGGGRSLSAVRVRLASQHETTSEENIHPPAYSSLIVGSRHTRPTDRPARGVGGGRCGRVPRAIASRRPGGGAGGCSPRTRARRRARHRSASAWKTPRTNSAATAKTTQSFIVTVC